MTWKIIILLLLAGGIVGGAVLAAFSIIRGWPLLTTVGVLHIFVLTPIAHAVTKWDDFEDDSVIP